MQLYPIVLIAVLLMADGGLGFAVAGPRLEPGAMFGVVLGGVLLLLGFAAGGVAGCRHRIDTLRRPSAVIAAGRIVRATRGLLLAHFAFVVLGLGWLETVRGVTGNLVVIDEVLALLPTIGGVAATWWLYYPVERRVREALLIRFLDEGRAVFPLPDRGVWVWTQLRTHLFFLLVPILLILALSEVIDAATRMLDEHAWARGIGELGTLVAAVIIVMTAPLLSRLVLDVEPLGAGPQRDDLERVCSRHRVKVRELLVWKTHGSMINAAVLGLTGRLRYVLLTDALLESMTPRQVEAVMAHEIGHIRRHHMPWLLVALLAAITAVATPLLVTQVVLVVTDSTPSAWFFTTASATVGGAAGIVAVLVLFGWVSRRFERQADVFAVAHLDAAAGDETGAVFSEASVDTVCGTLARIARLNAVAPTRSSWRHGSIAWRQAYLRSVTGRPYARLPLDRQVAWIKAVAAAVAAAGVVIAAILAA